MLTRRGSIHAQAQPVSHQGQAEGSNRLDPHTESHTLQTVAHGLLRWVAPKSYSQTAHAILLTDPTNPLQTVKSGMESPGVKVRQLPPKAPLNACRENAQVKDNDRVVS